MFDLSQYEDVQARLERYWKAYPNGRIETNLTHHIRPDGRVEWVCISSIYRDHGDIHPFSTGWATEIEGSSPVNKTNASENCETSAIGRSIGNGMGTPIGKRPSREEMGKVERVKAGEQVKGDVWSVKTGDEALEAFAALATLNPQVVVEEAKETCDHGVMIYKTGTAKSTGKPWARWDCSWDNKECSKWVNLK
jgi:hypothetical protein